MIPGMNADPKGYYAQLAVPPDATAEEIAAAFRRRARVVHPDVPGTGDTAAFVALKAAYDVLADHSRRTEYDRSALSPSSPPPPVWARAAPAPKGPPVRQRYPHPAFFVSVGLLGFAAVAAVLVLVRLASPFAEPPPPPPTPATARPALPRPLPVVRLTGNPTHYVVPGAGPAILWLRDGTGQRLVPAARLPPFTPVHALAFVPKLGLIAVALEGGGFGFVDAARLTPGDAVAARQAFCADQSGPPPGNAEVLARRGTGGQSKLLIHNRGEQPAVVKLRDLDGHAQAMVFIAPGVSVQVIGLPGGPWRADVAVGELWSRACAEFAAGMRAERLAGTIQSGGELTLPPGLPAAEDIPDEAFVHN
jgi:DnaJ domain